VVENLGEMFCQLRVDRQALKEFDIGAIRFEMSWISTTASE
jgi:hypothetical protein